jgi:protein AroM
MSVPLRLSIAKSLAGLFLTLQTQENAMLGFVTIGQAPREDIIASMLPGVSNEVIQAGALDDLAPDEIRQLQPEADEHTLVSRLRTGEQVRLSKRKLMPHLQAAIERLEDRGASVTCVLCTGAFPALAARGRLVFPDQILRAVVDVLLPAGRLGVLMPDAGQAEMMRLKWSHAERDVFLASASPYLDDEPVFSRAVRELLASEPDLIVMDCMGFTREMQRWIQVGNAVPVVLSNALVGGVLGETAGLSRALNESLQV